MALRTDGILSGWGSSSYGQLGISGNSSRFPTTVPGHTSFTAVSAGDTHTVAVKSNGTVWSWGKNDYGQLGYSGSTANYTPTQVFSGVIAVTTGGAHTVALKSDGTVWAWGRNNYGQLGDGTATQQRTTPAQVTGLSGVIAISAGSSHTIALKSDGTVWAWGYNGYGQLGAGSVGTYRNTPVQVTGLSGVIAIDSRYEHTLALKSNGTVWAWGNNLGGTLGDGSTTPRSTPVQISGLSNVTGIGAGYAHSLALKTDGTVWAWGSNGYGQLGDGTAMGHLTPAQVVGVTGVAAISAGRYNSTAMKTDGKIWGWGANGSGQLGDGTVTTKYVPAQASGINDVAALSAGYQYTVALRGNGTVWGWGSNTNGQLGDGTTVSRVSPTQINTLTNVTAIQAGKYQHTVALKSDGTVWAWGYNGSGQVGDGTTTNRSVPVPVNGLSNVTAIATGYSHSLALKGNGTVWAWGGNGSGQLGDGTTTPQLAPIQVPALTGIIAIAAGYNHSLAIKNDGTVWAWGYNGSGQVGNDTTTDCLEPVKVNNLTGIAAISAGQQHSLALTGNGIVWAWGLNSDGQLGEGTTTGRLSPIQLASLAGITTISANYNHSMAVAGDGTVWGWGDNSAGQLGDGTAADHSTPVHVSGVGNVAAASTGYQHSAALLNDGTVWGWGNNANWELADPKNASPNPASINLDKTLPTVTADKSPDTYNGNVTVSLTCSDDFSGCNGIWYTEDGSSPTTASTLYSGPLNLTASTDLRYIVKDAAGNSSAIGGGVYTVVPNSWSLLVTVNGSGTIHSTSTPVTPDINCSGGCIQSLTSGTVVTLTASPAADYTLSGWSGDCSGTGNCSVTMSQSRAVSASFLAISGIGACGTAHNSLSAIAPTTDLCASGAPSAVTGIGPWFWTCSGTVPAACSATQAGGVLHRSSDAGVTWQPGKTGLNFNNQITTILPSPTYATDQTLFLGAATGIYRSSDRGDTWSQVQALYNTSSLAASPNYASDRTLFAGGGYLAGVYRSTDGGDTWATSNTGLDSTIIFSLALSPAYGTDQTVFAGLYGNGVYKSIDGGASWNAANTGIANLSALKLAVSPNYATDTTLFAVTTNGQFPNPAYRLYKSVDGGAAWALSDSGVGGTLADLAISPAYATDQTLFAATSSGIYKTTDGGSVWTQVSPIGSAAAHMAISPDYASDQTVLVSIHGDNVYRSTNGGTTWSASFGDFAVGGRKLTALAISPAFATDQTVFTATSLAGPRLTVSPATLSFGTVKVGSTTASRTITLANTDPLSDTNLSIGSIILEGTNASSYQLNPSTCGSLTPVVPVGSSCDIVVTFTPVISGVNNALVRITSNDPANSSLVVGLNGTGVAVTSVITFPATGMILNGWLPVIGTANGNGETISKVEVSSNGGVSWVTANGTTNWSAELLLPQSGSYTIISRATTASGFVETPGTGVTITNDTMSPVGTLSLFYGVWTLNAAAMDVGIYCFGVYPNICGSLEMSHDNTNWVPATTTPGTGDPLWLRDRAGNVTYIPAGSQSNANGGPVKIPRAAPVYYSTIQYACDNAANGETVLLTTTTLTGPIALSQNIAMTIRGGFDSSHSSVIGTTAVEGNLSINTGDTSIENISLSGNLEIVGGTLRVEGVTIL